MKFTFLKKRKFWLRFSGVLIGIPIILFSVVLLIVYINQDEIIQSEVDALNKGHKGQVFIGDTHLEPFKNFPTRKTTHCNQPCRPNPNNKH